MSSLSTLALVPPAPPTILPHRPLRPDQAALPGGAVRCPRCGQPVALPAEARDGDLTECAGLLLRITRDAHGTLLERL